MTNDLELIKKQAETVVSKEDIDLLKQDAIKIIVNDYDSLGRAGDVLKIVKAKIKYLDDERKRFTAPLESVKKQIIAQFKPQIEKFEELKTFIEGKMFDFEEGERLKQLTDGDITPITAKGNISKTEYRDNWKYEVIDQGLVWAELKSPDDTKIKAKIKAGYRELAGLRIYNEPYTVSK